MSLKSMERLLYTSLSVLRDAYGCEGIKSEFENEGSDYRDIILLRYLTARTGLKMYIKIGGVEAFTDLKLAIHLAADGIVVPMVESKFALIKSQNMIEDILGEAFTGFDIFINIETKTAVENLPDIFSVMKPYVKGITIGRSDLAYSYNFKGEQDSPFVNKKVAEIIAVAHKHNVDRITIGGGISKKTFASKFLVDHIIPSVQCIETRNVILNSQAILKPDALTHSLEFERDYLKYKLEKSRVFMKMDENRFDTLMERG